MKFAKQLKFMVNECEPDWASHFVAYKELKKEFAVGKYNREREKEKQEENEDGNKQIQRQQDQEIEQEKTNKRKKEEGDKEKRAKKHDKKKKKKKNPEEQEHREDSENVYMSDDSSTSWSSSSSSSSNSQWKKKGKKQQCKASSSTKSAKTKRPRHEDTSPPATHPRIGECCIALKGELKKVNQFYLDKVYAFDQAFQHVQTAVKSLVRSCSSTGTSRQQIMRMKDELIQLHKQMVQLELYSIVNYMGFRKILKKLDKKHGTELKKRSLCVFRLAPFFSVQYLKGLVENVIALLADLERISKFVSISLEEYSNDEHESESASDNINTSTEEENEDGNEAEADGEGEGEGSEADSNTMNLVPVKLLHSQNQPQTVYISRNLSVPSAPVDQLISSMMIPEHRIPTLIQTVREASDLPMSAVVVHNITSHMDAVKIDPQVSRRFLEMGLNHPVNVCLEREPREISPSDPRVPMSVSILCVPMGCELQLLARKEPGYFARVLEGTCEFRQYASIGLGDENRVILRSLGPTAEECHGPWHSWTLVKEARHHTIHAISNCMVLYVTCGGLSSRPRHFLEELVLYDGFNQGSGHARMVQFSKSRYIQYWEEISL
mmetsp:Transcript_304/g.534  ORF Transcript_304/g.534 Transcript_304/m.534 type:complete len:607 (+) Transcript_304:277-2097(+)